MTENNEEAAELVKRSGKQAKQAGKNAGRAAKVAAEPVIEGVVEEVSDTVDKLEGTADDAVRAARRVDVNMLGRLSNDMGVGFLALSVSIYSGVIAYAKFRQAFSGSRRVTGI